jgi:hypothetical protein
MKTTLDLPDALVKQMKLRALHEGKKFKDAVADTLRAGLAATAAGRKAAKPKRAVLKRDRKTGLLVIQGSPDAPGRRMTGQQALALEQETLLREDLERAGISF